MSFSIYVFSIIIIGLLAGSVTAMTGASGVIVVVPLTNLLLSFPMYLSIGTSLLVDTISCLAISYSYYRSDRVDMRSGIWVALGCILGAQIGASLVNRISSPKLGTSFGIVLVIMGIVMWKKGISQTNVTAKTSRLLKAGPRQRAAMALGIGLLVGMQAGVLGIGGGIYIFLILVFIFHYGLHKAIGTSTFIMSMTACSGAMGYALRNNMNYGAGIGIGLSAVLGGFLSARLANRFNERTLARVISCIFISLGICLILMQNVRPLNRRTEALGPAGKTAEFIGTELKKEEIGK